MSAKSGSIHLKIFNGGKTECWVIATLNYLNGTFPGGLLKIKELLDMNLSSLSPQLSDLLSAISLVLKSSHNERTDPKFSPALRNLVENTLFPFDKAKESPRSQRDASEFITVVLQALSELAPKFNTNPFITTVNGTRVCACGISDSGADIHCYFLASSPHDCNHFSFFDSAQTILHEGTKHNRCQTCTKVECMIREYTYGEYVSFKLEKSGILGSVRTRQGLPLNQSIDGKQYELQSFISHEGNDQQCGHYIAYYKTSGIWYELNDHICSVVEDCEISAIDTPKSSTAVFATYKRISLGDDRINVHGEKPQFAQVRDYDISNYP
jgi:hypothetical protein